MWVLLVLAGGALFVPSVSAQPLAQPAAPEFTVERRPVPNGAELLTVYGNIAGKSEFARVPLMAVLRDTLGDSNPSNDKLRYVWILTSTRPTLLQRAAAAIPFFYWRPDLGKNADRTPSPVLDLGAPSHGVYTAVAASIAQITALDGNGVLLRASTRRYRANVLDHRKTHLMEGSVVLAELEKAPASEVQLTQPELFDMEARLTLAAQTFGGLVDARKLPDAYRKQKSKTEQARGHNWELLRQRAESNGLYFEPLGLDEHSTHAILWVAKEDAAQNRPFNNHFLGISNPFGDARVKNWSGYAISRTYDSSNRVVPAGTANSRTVELVPLALYSLDYPKSSPAAGGLPSIPFQQTPGNAPARVHRYAHWHPGHLAMGELAVYGGLDGLQLRALASRRSRESNGALASLFRRAPVAGARQQAR